ncbi:TPA: aminotransferase class I/II-fold pyridoxal phosphate-dependent enzyme [Candidatus Woesearchaeota archaeon]|nr:aminotransferase class I/II-fold pyridoxal phosphate-dependent enzyme [Candidatus Woesearchaeota archaeon]HII68503.1 aminotransferase class I/II-fold pyridoxal phosphate-dependent enzyme [Candidatus Woesearchaeota archaeon]
MPCTASERIKSLPGYAFADIDSLVAEQKKKGIKVIDFGVGDPTDPTPGAIRNHCKRAIDKHKSSGYPSYIGSKEFREGIANWCGERFKISLDPDREICSTMGGKEGVFHFPLGFVNSGDYVISPNPGYPPYERGTMFAGGNNHFYNLEKDSHFLPDLESIPKDVVKKAKILWLNYPNNPTGALAPKLFLKEAADFGHDNGIIIASDEVYSELYYDEKPASILEVTREGVIAFQSLSKRSNMTGYRIGWAMGDESIISVFKKVKTNIDSGTPDFIQDAAIAALQDQEHVEIAKADYRKKADILSKAFTIIGLADCRPKGAIYIWQEVPKMISGVDFAKKLVEKGVVGTPGAWISRENNRVNPGKQYVRFALVPSIPDCREAAEKIREIRL